MINFIQKIFNHFGYTIKSISDISETDLLKQSLLDKDNIISNLNKDKNNFLKLIEDKDKNIDMLKLENKKIKNDNINLLKRIKRYKQKADEKYRQINKLKSTIRWLINSRDKYKLKYNNLKNN